MKRLPATTWIPLLFAALKVVLHLAATGTFGFHRDELLYLALGQHPDWGFWSNPPFVGAVTWFSQTFMGDSLPATRLPSVLAGAVLLWLTLRMVSELGGGAWAQVICGAAMLVSVAWLRVNSMLQPVPFDVLFWALLSFGLLKWLNTRDGRWWYFIGATAGLAFLNKYTLVFWAISLLIALALTPERKVFLNRQPWQAAGLALLIISPNLFWQWQYNFPVVHHLEELARYQLQNVQPVHFLLDQFLLHGPGFLLWLAGLLYLLLARAMQPYRLFAWFYVALLAVFLVLSGKSYYTLGAYPVLFAAGGVFWKKTLKSTWAKIALIATIAALALPLVPVGLPLYAGDKATAYFHWLTYDAGIDGAVRWEDGELHQLPQDFADMLGWEEIGRLVDSAAAQAGNIPYLIYGDNYGQAGAARYFSRAGRQGRGAVASFSDSWRLWAPDSLPASVQTLIYINDDEPGEDVQALFAELRLVGRVENPLARERGTGVWLCRGPRSDLQAFWAERVKGVKAVLKRR